MCGAYPLSVPVLLLPRDPSITPHGERWRRRKEAGEALPPRQKQPRAKTARKTKRPTTPTVSKPHAKADSPRKRGTGVAEPDLREVRASASSPAVIPDPLAAAAASAAEAVVQSPAAVVCGESEELDSPRARQRLKQAKELDQEVAAREGVGGG